MHNVYNADALRNLQWPQAGLKDGRYVLARPIGFGGWPQRLTAAWGVLTGKYDALQWTEQ